MTTLESSDEELLELELEELKQQQQQKGTTAASKHQTTTTVPTTGYFYNPGAPTTTSTYHKTEPNYIEGNNATHKYQAASTTSPPPHYQQQQKKIPIPGQQQQQEILDPRQYESGIRSASIEHARLLYNSKKFSFRTVELPIRDEYSGSNVVAYSVGEYLVQPDSQTKWVAYNVNALYQVVYGEPWFLIGDEGKTIPLGHYIVVPKATRHCIYNKSVNIECKVHIIFPGEIGIKENV